MLTSSVPASSGIEEDVWLPITSAARLLDLSERHVRRTLDRYVTRTIDGTNGRPAYEIALSSLPESARVAYHVDALPQCSTAAVVPDDPDDLMTAYQRAPGRIKRFYDKWAQILQESDVIVGRAALEAWTERWNAVHPDLETSAPSIYRMRDRVAKDGRISLLLQQAPASLSTSTVKDRWMDWFREAYLTQSKLSAPMARLIALGRARNEGEAIAENDFPSHHAFLRRLNRETAPDLIYRAREGEKRFNDRYGVSIVRDYSTLPVGSCWVGDTHTWDVFVSIPGQAVPVTCYITAFLDFRTYLPMGWYIHTCAPSTETTLRAIRAGIDRYGIPDDLYLDNGREYRNKDFSGITRGVSINYDEQVMSSLAARLNIQLHFAIVRNAQAKIIERQFLVMKNSFSRLWQAFKGGTVVEKPERLKQVVKTGNGIPTFEEFREQADRFLSEILPALPCSGAHHHGMTRAMLWNKLLPERAPLLRVSRATSAMLVTRTYKGRIRDRGFHLTPLDCWYWAEWMPMHKGREVILRYDSEDLTTAWAYDESLKIIGEAQLVQAVDALVQPGDAIGKALMEDGIATRRRERRLLKELFPDANPREASQMIDDLRSALPSEHPDPGIGPIQLTLHDHDASHLRRDAQEGTADYSRFAS